MNIANANVTIKTSEAIGKVWLSDDVFYVVSGNGVVSLWATEEDEAIQLSARHPGTSGKTAEVIAKELFGA